MKPQAWTDAAHEAGLAAWRDAEAALVARRSPAERAREPLPEELARLADLEAAVELAALDRQDALDAVRDSMPWSWDKPGKKPASAEAIAKARDDLERADRDEARAQAAATDFRLRMSAAATERALRVTGGK